MWVIWRLPIDFDPDEAAAYVEIIRITDDEEEAIKLGLEHRAFMTLTPVTLKHHTEVK